MGDSRFERSISNEEKKINSKLDIWDRELNIFDTPSVSDSSGGFQDLDVERQKLDKLKTSTPFEERKEKIRLIREFGKGNILMRGSLFSNPTSPKRAPK